MNFETGLTFLDWGVLGGYFLLMTIIGIWSMFLIKKQEDYFLGSRSFGKILQTFASFGAGTNASDPIVTAKTTFTNGLSGIWSALFWLFVTPFYWIVSVWYRRMRHLTLGDWFAERYQSRSLAFAYMIFGVIFYITYLGVGMTAIGKMGAPLVGSETLSVWGISLPFEKVIVIVTALTVLIYGVLGGLRAAYWTDLVQGIFIILLSIILIPVGLQALVDEDAQTQKHTQIAHLDQSAANLASSSETAQTVDTVSTIDAGDTIGTVSSTEVGTSTDAAGLENSESKRFDWRAEGEEMLQGFTVLHERVPAEYFEIVTSPKSGEFPLYYILAITILNLLGIVCQPHFIATGGGAAKTEFNARFGLVAGNILKRFCTIGWALTALVALAYLASNMELAEDPDRVWGVATRELLGPMNCGLVGLMLACLLAALMSSASCYMLVVSGLVVRNGYAAYINPNASEKTCVFLGRLCGAIVILGATIVSLVSMNVFEQLKFSWEIPLIFVAPFWVGMYWRRANKYSAWGTVLLTLILFFLLPMNLTKLIPDLNQNPQYTLTNQFVVVRESRKATLTDVQRREAARALWSNRQKTLLETEPNASQWTAEEKTQKVFATLGTCPAPLVLGETLVDEFKTGGKAVFWSKGVVPHNRDGEVLLFDSTGRVFAKEREGKREFVDSSQNLFDEASVQVEQLSKSRERRTYAFKSSQELAEDGIVFKGVGNFEPDFLLYQRCGLALDQMSNGMLETLRLPIRIIFPFIFLIMLSLVTPRGNQERLDQYFVKMKTPVCPNPEEDAQEMEVSRTYPHRFEHKRLFPFWGLEINKPTWTDVVGFVVTFALCFAIIALIVALAQYQP